MNLETAIIGIILALGLIMTGEIARQKSVINQNLKTELTQTQFERDTAIAQLQACKNIGLTIQP